MKTKFPEAECFEMTITGKSTTASDPLYTHLLGQGLTREQAEELCERKAHHPTLTGVTFNGQWVSLSPSSSPDTLRAMLESGQAPQSKTDREFWAGRWEDEDQITRRYRKEAEASGVSTNGKFYSSSLARFPGDPQAFVSDRHDVQKLIESRPGWQVSGMVQAQGAPIDAEPVDVPLADDILDGRVGVELLKNPGLREKPREEVREAVAKKATPHWKKKKKG